MPVKLTTYYHGKDIPELPGSKIFHSKDLFLFYEVIPHYAPLLIVASINEKPIAKLLALVRRGTAFLPFPLLKRCEVYGMGDFFDDSVEKEGIFNELLEHLTNEASRHAFFIEFRNLEHALDGYKYFRANNYFAVNWLRVRNSLHDKENLMEQLSESRQREVKKGLKNGAQICEATNMDEIMEFAKMIYKIYSFRIRKYFPSVIFFNKMKELLIEKKLAKLFVVKYKGKIIGGSAVLYSEDNAYLWFSGGMTKRHAMQRPGVLAVWGALNDAKQNGYAHLEYTDVGLPFQKHGYRNFLLRFGGDQFSTRRWFRIRWNFINKLLIKLYA